MRRVVAAVAVAGSLLTACSSETPEPFKSETPLRGSVIAAQVIAEDIAFDPQEARRPRFFVCQGLSGCARSSPVDGEYYPGVVLASAIDSQVDFDSQFAMYVLGASFEEATLDQTTVHIRVTPRRRGFQMVKLDGTSVLPIIDPQFRFEGPDGTAFCSSTWGGCG
jgi:hypothetical protein